MIDLIIIFAVIVLSHYTGYLHGVSEGRHRQKWGIPTSIWKG